MADADLKWLRVVCLEERCLVFMDFIVLTWLMLQKGFIMLSAINGKRTQCIQNHRAGSSVWISWLAAGFLLCLATPVFSKMLDCCQNSTVSSSAESQRPLGRRGMAISSSCGLCFESFEPWGIFKQRISISDGVPGSTQGFCRHIVADSASHSDWRQAAQFNPEKMETAVL